MKNKDIKNYAKANGVRLWRIAEALHINDGNFSRRLRKEMSEAQKQEIVKIIDELSRQKDGETSMSEFEMTGNIPLHSTPETVTDAVAILRHELLTHGEVYNGFKASLKTAIEKYCTCGLPFEPEEETAGKILDFMIGEEQKE